MMSLIAPMISVSTAFGNRSVFIVDIAIGPRTWWIMRYMYEIGDMNKRKSHSELARIVDLAIFGPIDADLAFPLRERVQ
jgi:hypothetical protein